MRSLRLPEGVPQCVRVWQLDLDLEAGVASDDWGLLAADERERASRLRRPEDRARAVCTRASLRRLLARDLDVQPESLEFEVGPHGKPRLCVRTASNGSEPGDVDLRFNVSHAGEHALIAIAHGCDVGIDLERDEPAIVDEGLTAHVLSALEHGRAPHGDLGFRQRWVAKEAALKALGVGIAEHLRSLSVLAPEVRTQDGASLFLQHDQAWPALRAAHLPAPGGYVAALAWIAEDSET